MKIRQSLAIAAVLVAAVACLPNAAAQSPLDPDDCAVKPAPEEVVCVVFTNPVVVASLDAAFAALNGAKDFVNRLGIIGGALLNAILNQVCQLSPTIVANCPHP